MRRAAIANIRPSCPLPSTPMVAPGSIGSVTSVLPTVHGPFALVEKPAASRAAPYRGSPAWPPPAVPRFAHPLFRSLVSPPERRQASERSTTASPCPLATGSPQVRPAPAAWYSRPPSPEDAPRPRLQR